MSIRAAFALFDTASDEDDAEEERKTTRATVAKRSAPYITGGATPPPTPKKNPGAAVIFSSSSDEEDDADDGANVDDDDEGIIFPGRRSFVPSGGAPPPQRYAMARDTGLTSDPAYVNAMGRGPARPERAFDPDVQRVIASKLEVDPVYAFATQVAGRLGQPSLSPFIENEHELTQRVTQYITDKRQHLKAVKEQLGQLSTTSEELLRQQRENEQHVKTLVSQQLPQIDIVSPTLDFVSVLRKYIQWLHSMKDGPKDKAMPPPADDITSVSTWLDNLLSAFGALGGISPDGRAVGSDTLKDLTAFLSTFQRAIAITDADTPRIHPPTKDTPITLDIPWMVKGEARLLRVPLASRDASTIVAVGQPLLEIGEVYTRVLQEEQSKFSVADATRAIQAARAALASVVRVSDNMVLRPADIMREAGREVSNFVLEVVAARVLQYEPARNMPELAARGVVTRDNRDSVSEFVATLIAGAPLVQLFNRLLESVTVAGAGAGAAPLFTQNSAFATRARPLLVLLMPTTAIEAKEIAPLSSVDIAKADATWTNAIAQDPRLALARFYARYTIVRLYIVELINQIVSAPDTIAVLQVQQERKRLVTEHAALQQTLVDLSGDRLLGGARRAFDPHTSGILRLTAQLKSAISGAESFIHTHGPLDFSRFSMDEYLFEPQGRSRDSDNEPSARDFYNLLVDLVAYHVRDANKGGFITSITAGRQQVSLKDMLRRLQLFKWANGRPYRTQ